MHEGHVRCGGRHEGLSPTCHGRLHQRMALVDGRGMHSGAALLGVRLEQLLHDACRLLIGVGIGGAYVDDKAALVGDDIVLCAGIDLCDGHLDVAQQLGAAVEAEVLDAFDVFDSDIDFDDPDRPVDVNSYVAAEVRILSWRVVKNEYNVE